MLCLEKATEEAVNGIERKQRTKPQNCKVAHLDHTDRVDRSHISLKKYKKSCD